MDFPFINKNFTGMKHKYDYTQVVDLDASSEAGLCMDGDLAKLCFDEQRLIRYRSTIKMEYYGQGEDNFYSGSVFIPKPGGNNKEDDGQIAAFVHNEETDVSQVHVIYAKNFEGEPAVKIRLPQRVPYGFHVTFAKKQSSNIR